jgi:hypothetical protein
MKLSYIERKVLKSHLEFVLGFCSSDDNDPDWSITKGILSKLGEDDENSATCDCEGWGCSSCCSSDAEIRQRQGIFS